MSLTIIPALLKVNFSPGRAGHRVLAICLHVSAGTEAGAVSWFSDPASTVSAHYLVCKDGRVLQFVRDEDCAWANGILNRPDLSHPLVKRWATTPADPSWPAGLSNLETISIEREGQPGEPIPAAQWASEVQLIAHLCLTHGLEPDRSDIVGHHQIDSVNRPNCPGFDAPTWSRLIGAVGALVHPRPTFGVGAGLAAAMAAAGDTPLGPERYLKDGAGADAFSVAAGEKGLYIYAPDSGKVHVIPRV